MAGSKYSKFTAVIPNLHSDAWKLFDVVTNDPDVNSNDWGKLGRVCEQISSLWDLMMVNWSFPKLLNEVEDEKAAFLIQKEWYSFIDKFLFEKNEQLLSMSKTWKFEDYRIINLQDEIRKFAQDFKAFLQGAVQDEADTTDREQSV